MEEKSDRGAVAVTVALLLVVLLGFGALAIDTGMLYAQKAQLQNGADAGALAIAQDCAKRGTAACKPTAAATAVEYAQNNANSGLADAAEPAFPAAGTVTVTTSAKDAPASASARPMMARASAHCASTPSGMAPVAWSVPVVPETWTQPPATTARQ